MGLLDKLKFWKKENDFVSPEMPSFESAPPMQQPSFEQVPPSQGLTEPFAEQNFGQQQRSSFDPPEAFGHMQAMTSQPSAQDSQLQLISLKLDTIKAQLETVLQRLERLERKSEETPYQQRWRGV